jgi:cell fate (sporulation/competence/biofilm development) regulator YlbF (YheA/YmcA/DUF963 family)
MEENYITLTDQLIQSLLNHPDYLNLIRLKKLIDHSEELNALTETFNKAKETYYEAKKYGKYHPDLKRYQKAFQEAKTLLFTHELIVEYKTSEKGFQTLLDTISETLAKTVSPQVNFEARFKVNKKGGSTC